MKNNQKSRISKTSTRTFNTGRFSATTGFTAGQQTILNSFNRIRDNAEVQSSSVPTETEPSVEQGLVCITTLLKL